ncbi:Peptidoglycan/LPS O-acetylase OafA/YrhL, contains acyltransferase and SGNH-hydrolase domains [Pseudomonas asplenii]|uniref:Peptidoglycan/LPS O-acetylase OafA/YrhL, contains acyltransferase and SGNH-hydrolase domains n=1 Tax=Pseudomonas asplenii TaxID=53407 RepID=A0A1H1WYX2_9PSED|nr:acyltransferase [Pseudomonas asplenii]SDT02255.1 Peptidoglycan/LPS O-acetylase OafA/YrhL, contains acyltransferase and SGNH-hydrolase domains [Pseudomonas asplenii]
MGMLRLFLALSVLVHHTPKAPFHWLHASIAVMFFFMISGFYMTLVINEKYIKSDTPWVTKFYLSRVFRIFPVYLAMLAFMIVWYIYTDTPSAFTDNLGHGFFGQLSLIFMNLFILGQDWHQLTSHSFAKGDINSYMSFISSHIDRSYFENSVMLIGQAWTLSVELIFYILAPFVVHSRRRIIILLLASLLVRAVFWNMRESFNPIGWGYYFLPATLCFFLMGSLGYYFYRQLIKWPALKNATLPINIIVLGGVFYILFSGGYPVIGSAAGYDTPALWMFYCVFALCLPFVFLLWKDNRIDRWLGEFSYPTYIVHGLIIGMMLKTFGLPAGTYSTQAIIIGTSLFIAWFACFAIETPFNQWRQRRIIAPLSPELTVRSRKPLAWSAAATVTVCLYIAWLTAYTPRQAPPPILVAVESAHRYNIVNYDEKFYGIPFGMPIKWGAPHYEQTQGLIIANTQKDVSEAIYKNVNKTPALAILVKVEQEYRYNIVSYDDKFYGIPFGTPIEWGGLDYEQTPGLIIARTQQAVMDAITRKVSEISQ